jgi:predicted nucleic acid-binding protein
MPASADLPVTLVVDASVGLKWVVMEPGSEMAVALIEGRQLLVPDLFWIETANGLAAKVRRDELSRAAAQDAWHDLLHAPITARPTTPDIVTAALALAQDLRHPVYDCLYLSLAIVEHCPMVTADRRFAEVVRAQPYLAERIIVLDEI